MENKVYFDQTKKLYTSIIFFLDETDDDENFKEILKNFDDIRIEKKDFINLCAYHFFNEKELCS